MARAALFKLSESELPSKRSGSRKGARKREAVLNFTLENTAQGSLLNEDLGPSAWKVLTARFDANVLVVWNMLFVPVLRPNTRPPGQAEANSDHFSFFFESESSSMI